MKNFQFSKYCTPAQLYLILGGIGIITAFFNKFSIETILTKALFLVIWAWVLNWLCSKGFKAISWILVLLPFIMVLFTYFLTKDVAVKEGYALSDDPKKRADEIAAFAADNAAAAKAAAAKAAADKLAANRAASAAAAAERARNTPSATAGAVNSVIETGLSYMGG